MSYKQNDYQVLRDDVVIAVIDPVTGKLTYTEGCEKYHPHVVKMLTEAGNWDTENACAIVRDIKDDPLKNGGDNDDEDDDFEDDDDDDDDDDETGKGQDNNPPPPVPATRITTTRQLVVAMQLLVDDPCPPMTHWQGDRTPAVLDWIQKHDDARRQVLKAANLNN